MRLKEESEKVGLKFNIKKKKLKLWHHHFDRKRKNKNTDRFYFLFPKSLRTVTVAMKFKDACSLEGKL